LRTGVKNRMSGSEKVERISLAQEPGRFVENATVKAVVDRSGGDELPAILIGDQLVASGRYPGRDERMLGADEPKAASGSCCGGNRAKQEKTSTGCWPEHTKILIVTLPETTPVLEAAHLREDLRRAGIKPWGWIVNASLAAAETNHPLLRLRAASEAPQIAKVRDELAPRYAVVAMQAEEPIGRERLIALYHAGSSEKAEGLRRVGI
jgi:hypothetical protein